MEQTDRASTILTFWFGEQFSRGMPTSDRHRLWFGFSPAIDRKIKQLFERDVAQAASGRYNGWKATAKGRLALIILLDQFPRNIYRGTRQAFAYDEQAVELCLQGLELGHDRKLLPVCRSFFYLPLEHSESLDLQRRCVTLFRHLYREADPAIRDAIKVELHYAELHCDIIQRFGRFPHRNLILGRTTTVAERRYLEQSAHHFGQPSR